MLTQQLNKVSMNQDEDNVPSSRLSDLKQRKREKESKEMPLKINSKLEWRPKDCAQSIGSMTRCTGEGVKKKCHYKTFKFHGNQYGLDIFVQRNEGYLNLEVERFYRPDDIAKKYVGNWESKDSRDLFYSFHRDEVFAEFVMHKCLVYFVPEKKKRPNRKEHPGFIVQKVYDHVKKKLIEFSYQGLDMQQKDEIDHLVKKTISRVGDLPDLEEVQMTKISRRKKSVPKKFISKSQRNDVALVVRALEQTLYGSFGEDIPKYNYKVKILVDELKNSRVLTRRLLNGELKPEQAIMMTGYELTRGFTFEELILEENVASTS